ncbi:MAG: acylphosphatase [Nanoarchaeota archaeon]|nr:acylphosphatase [Nanoarchaeota archaeon]MBU1135615.1 acylphosphatase [Nanoarchaeota archaeon]MBU2519614.1 acylphosphatase [Nanoarchaeota archaeon]
MKKRAHLFISGKVQGVFFRSFVKSQAKLHDVNGWVKNLPDSRVEAVFEDEDYKVDAIIEACRQGPPGAEVKNVEVEWEKTRGMEAGFEIKR